MPAEGATVQDNWIDVPAGRIFTRVWSPESPGSRAPVVLLHDSLGCVDLWRGFPLALSQSTGRQVVAYDRLGFGKSDAHPGRLALDFVASEAGGDFSAVMQHLGNPRFIAFGHSVGGGMAVHCAARFPEACVGLVTESAQALVEDRTIAGIEEARDLFRDETQLNRLAKYHGEKTRWVLDAWIGSWLHPDFASWSLEPVLPLVACPALVIHGRNDEYGSPRHPERMVELMGRAAQLELMADSGHVPHREREADVVRRVAAFVTSLP
jgi:pimeloyl-ACP methyl ester carboxylesterase